MSPSLTKLPHRKLFPALAASLQEIVILTDDRKKILFANRRAAQATGYAEKALVGATLSLLYRKDQSQRFAGLTQKHPGGSRAWRGRVELRAKDGHSFWVEMTVEAIHGEGGVVAGLLYVGRDLPAQRKRSQRSWEQQDRLLAICESMEDGVAVCDQKGTILMCNDAYARRLGYGKDEVVGTGLSYPWTDQESAATMKTAFRIFFKEHILHNHLVAVRRKDGSTAIMSLGLSPLRSDGKRTAEIVMTMRDVTDVQYAQEARRASDQLYRLQLEVKRKAERLQTLQDINAFVLKNADVDQIFRAITTGIKNLVGHDLAGIYLYDPERELFFAHTLSKQTPFSRRLAKFPLPIGVGIIGTAAMSGKLVWVNNAQLDPRSRYPKGMRPEKEHFIAVPLKGRTSIFGILVVARNRDPEFIEEEALIVKSFADAATVALENAQLHHDLAGAPEPVRHSPRPATLAGSRVAGKRKTAPRASGRVLSRLVPPARRGV